MDAPDTSAPYFDAPLGVQGDVYEMTVVLPGEWLDQQRYDWSESGSISIVISGLRKGHLEGHEHSFTIAMPAGGTQ